MEFLRSRVISRKPLLATKKLQLIYLKRSLTSVFFKLMFLNDSDPVFEAMQDCAKANHDLGKDANIKNVLDKCSMVANPFFGNSHFLILFIFIALVSIAFSNFSNFSTFPQ